MRNPTIKDVRRVYVLDILIREDHKHEKGISQKEISKRVVREIYDEKTNSVINHKVKTDFRGKELEKKIYTAVSKTVNSLERDGIITIRSLRTPGKRGAHQNVITLNKDLKSFYMLLKVYQTLKAYTDSQPYNTNISLGISVLENNLLKSEYYNNIVNRELVDKLTSLSWLPFNGEDKNLFYYLILVSPEALGNLFSEVYTDDFILLTEKEANNEQQKMYIEYDRGESYKEKFIDRMQLNIIKMIFNSREIPNFNLEGNINVKFKDNQGNVHCSFSNKREVNKSLQPHIFPFFDFV